PGLDELPDRLKAFDELVGGEQRSLAAVRVADELPGCDAGRRVEKAHIVVVGRDPVLDPVQEALHLDLSSIAEGLLAGMFEGEPDLARPEARRPLVICD